MIYRGNFLLRAAFGVVPLVATVFIWRAVFDADGGGERGGYTLPAAVNYFLLVILAESLITPTEDEWQIAADIRDGHLNALLSKPLNYFGYRTCLFFSSRVAYTVITLPVTAALFWWFGSFDHLPGPGVCLLTAWSLAMAALLQFFIAYALALLAFWILEVSTVIFILYSFEYFLSGQLVPAGPRAAGCARRAGVAAVSLRTVLPVSVFLEKHGASRSGGLGHPGRLGPRGVGCGAGAVGARAASVWRGGRMSRKLLAMRRHWEVYKILCRNSLIREMSFKANFLLWMVTELLWFAGQIVLVDVLFLYTENLAGWTKWEVVALIGTNQIIVQIFQAFFYMNLTTLPELVRTGLWTCCCSCR